MIKRSKQSGIQILKGLTASFLAPTNFASLKMLAIYFVPPPPLRILFEDELVTIYAQTLETMPPFPPFYKHPNYSI